MKKNDILIKKMQLIAEVEEDKVIYKVVTNANHLSFLKIRDSIYGNGIILYENDENKIYIILMNAGIWKMNQVILGIMVDESTVSLASYAKEGLINQRSAESAMNIICELLSVGNKP